MNTLGWQRRFSSIHVVPARGAPITRKFGSKCQLRLPVMTRRGEFSIIPLIILDIACLGLTNQTHEPDGKAGTAALNLDCSVGDVTGRFVLRKFVHNSRRTRNLYWQKHKAGCRSAARCTCDTKKPRSLREFNLSLDKLMRFPDRRRKFRVFREIEISRKW